MRILLLILLFNLVSCSTYIRTLSTRMISPEANGKLLKGSLDLGRVQSYQTFQMDFSGTKTNEPLTPVDGTYGAGASVDLGLLKRLDVFLIPSIVMSPTLFGAKFQFLGDPRNEAKKGNFSASVMVAFGARSESRTDGDNELDVIDGQIDKIKLEMEHDDIGLIVGYRWSDEVLHYVNGVIFDEKVEGNVTNNSRTLNDAAFNYNSHGLISSTGIIFYWRRLQVKLDYSHTISSWSNTHKETTNTFNGGIGFNW